MSIYLSIAFLASAIPLGGYLLSFVLKGQETRKGIAFLHGPLAAIGLIALVIASYETGWTSYLAPILIFVAAAAGGIVMISLDLTGHKVPAWLGVVHGVAAIGGFLWLLLEVL